MHFSPYTERLVYGSEGGAGILFKKILVGSVHLVTRAKKCCHKEALGLLVELLKTAASGIFRSICMQIEFFLHLQRDFFERVGVVRLFCSWRYKLELCF